MKIYVGNLSFSTSDDGLRNTFAPFGTVGEATVITDRESGRSRGFGFVEIADDEAAQAAIQALNGTSVDGRMLTVNQAKPRNDRSRSNAGRSW